MTRDECINRFHHQLFGIMLDLSRSGLTGAARSMLEDQAMQKIDALIAAIWTESQPRDVRSNNKTPVK